MVSDFVGSVYLRNKKTINKNINLYQKNWSKIEEKYFLLVDDLFSGYVWPKGKYIAYPTIWGMYPRFLEDKIFQIPYKYKKKNYVNVIIAHEMLHFIFYDFLFKEYPKYKLNKYSFFVWNISEIFNSVVQNSSKWLKIFKIKTISYPEHKNIINKLQKDFYRSDTIEVDKLIRIIIKNFNF